MGKAVVISHQGAGLYRVRIDHDERRINQQLAALRQYKTQLEDVLIPAAETERGTKYTAYLTAKDALDDAILMWRAHCT